MFTLINDIPIITKHYETLRDDAKTRFIVILFFIVPVMASLMLVKFNRLLTYESLSALLTAFAVFTGLILNVVFIIFDVVGKEVGGNGQDKANKNKKILLKCLFANTMYALLLSTIILAILILIVIIGDIPKTEILNIESPVFASFFTYFLISHFFITLLMIFRRLYILLYPRDIKSK